MRIFEWQKPGRSGWCQQRAADLRPPPFVPAAAYHLSASCLSRRITGFRLSLGSLALLTVLGALGIANSFLDEYLDLNVAKKLRPF